ncbi:MAG: molybdopterin-binding protein [Candidatus Thermoplasmatota archaeon]|nr:molybdopterin-binding protein [Candidatus Thermoplasmatota archaeon]
MIHPHTGAVLVVGSEILLGRTQDTNTLHLIRRLLERGIRLERWFIVPDDPDAISEGLRTLLDKEYDLVLISGGMGPTHDDITVESVARALGRGAEISEATQLRLLEKWMTRNPREQIPEGTAKGLRKMSQVVDGFRTLENPAGAVEGQMGLVGRTLVAIFPGVPREYKALLDHPLFLQMLPGHTNVVSEEVIYSGRESQIATFLEEMQGRDPDVDIGSYPQGPLKVIIRVTGDPPRVLEVADEIRRRVGPRT